MWFRKRTPKPSETELLLGTISQLATEVKEQSAAQRDLSSKLFGLLTERDAQLRIMLESRFESRIEMYPPKPPIVQQPEDTQHLEDVTGISEASATHLVEKDTAAYNKATETLEEDLEVEFAILATEHQAHHREPQA